MSTVSRSARATPFAAVCPMLPFHAVNLGHPPLSGESALLHLRRSCAVAGSPPEILRRRR
jgi:hypothetical protein